MLEEKPGTAQQSSAAVQPAAQSSAPAQPAAPADSYAKAGVDVAAGDEAVELMAAAVRATHGPQVLNDGSGFGGLFDASALAGMREPVLVASTDGVGTKIELARALGIYDTIGQDLVAMVVDDLAAVGARPLFLTDYISCGKVVPERIAAIVGGIAAACAKVGTALIAGETAEHPGVMGEDEFDLAASVTGVVERSALLGPDRVQPGDAVVGIASSGLHSNGYSLVRAVLADTGWPLTDPRPQLGSRTLGEALLEPTVLYEPVCRELVDGGAGPCHAIAHITGGGLAANLARVLPADLDALIDRGSWRVPPIFDVIREGAGSTFYDLERSLNMGIGLAVVTADPDAVVAAAERHGLWAGQIGEVREAAERDNGVDGEGLEGYYLSAAADPHYCRVQGTKGVNGGAVHVFGRYECVE